MAKQTVQIDGKPVPVGTAAAYRRLAKWFRQNTGYRLGITSALRTYDEQAELYRKYKNGTGNLAAPPGTSLHETGRAIDVHDSGPYPGVTRAGNTRSNKFRNNAPRFGIDPTGYDFDEAWHAEYQGDPWKAVFWRRRYATWNLALGNAHGARTWKVRRALIARRVKRSKLDILAVQERPQKPGRWLDGRLVGSDGKPMKRVGASGRHIYLRSDTKVYGWASWLPMPKVKGCKPVTSACIELDSLKTFLVNGHAVTGDTAAIKLHRERWARKMFIRAIRRAKRQGLEPQDIVFMGDWNGPEVRQVAAEFGFVVARRKAGWRSKVTRTFNGFGSKHRDQAGGMTDYILVHEDVAADVERYRNVWTSLASDHNLVIAQIKE